MKKFFLTIELSYDEDYYLSQLLVLFDPLRLRLFFLLYNLNIVTFVLIALTTLLTINRIYINFFILYTPVI